MFYLEPKKICPSSVPTVKFSNGDIVVSPNTRMTKSLFCKSEAPTGIKLKKSRSFQLNSINYDYELCDEIIYMRKISKEFDSYSDYGSYITDTLSPLSDTTKSISKKSTPSSIDGGYEENYLDNHKITPELASYFSYYPYGEHLNSIEKSLLKKSDQKVRAFNEITLLSIELNSPIVIKSQKIVQETPLLITKLDRKQIKVNRQTRQLNICYQLNDYNYEDHDQAKTPKKHNQFKRNQDLDSILFENDNKICRRTSGMDHIKPPPAPGCIQSLALMVKYIKEKFSSKPKEDSELVHNLNRFGETKSDSNNDDEF